MYCRNCGKEIPDGSQFCKYCGATQKGEVKVPQPPINAQTSIPKNESEDSGNATKFIIVMGVIVALFMGYFLFFHKPTIDPQNYLTMEFSGYEGDCHRTLLIDYEGLTRAIGSDAITRAIQKVNPSYWIWWGDPNDYNDEDFVQFLYDFDVDYNPDAKNGDVFTARITLGELGYETGANTLEELNSIMRINLKPTATFVVSGLGSNGASIPMDGSGNSGNGSSSGEQTTEYGKVEILKNKIKIRQWASTSAPQIGFVNAGEVYTIYGVHEADGYTWYCIGNEMYIATKEGDWTRHINN